MEKTILLASFIFPERIDWFLNYLHAKFSIPKNKVFGFKNLDDETKIIVTFKLTITQGKHLDLKELFPNAVTIHKKGNALYTINALNKLIETKTGYEKGNIDYKTIKIDWNEYQNRFILIDNQKLSVYRIEKIF